MSIVLESLPCLLLSLLPPFIIFFLNEPRIVTEGMELQERFIGSLNYSALNLLNGGDRNIHETGEFMEGHIFPELLEWILRQFTHRKTSCSMDSLHKNRRYA